MFASDMAVVVIAALDERPISGITHAKPLPTHNTWAKKKVMKKAVTRRVRRIMYYNNSQVSVKVPSGPTIGSRSHPARLPSHAVPTVQDS